ncbi:hypothetical protein PR048_018313 [Dryococelus australis]|uniref:Uncharacterized protein n=1 Tax=Dryococelus australis TaxID=614101 RepID=A0ABQ9HC45_9NEOP|nr:hypothetical protein PR048_018313 [Dryococelus australis]
MERRWNSRAGETGIPRENPPVSSVVQHDSHMRRSGSELGGDRARIAVVGGERPSHCSRAAVGWSGAGMQGRGKREYPEKARRQATSPSTIPTCQNPGVNPPGIKPGSPWWEASVLATAPPLPYWETGDPRENPPTNSIVRDDSHIRESGVNRPGIEPGSPWWEASILTAQPPWPHAEVVHRRTQTTLFGHSFVARRSDDRTHLVHMTARDSKLTTPRRTATYIAGVTCPRRFSTH